MIILSQSQRSSIQAYILRGDIEDFLTEAEKILKQEGSIQKALSFTEDEKNKLSQGGDWKSYDEMAIVAMILKNSSLDA
ncbi:hypothetical protein K8R62_00150 [bacterium]|nr:hypothetical protein [bacterium]